MSKGLVIGTLAVLALLLGVTKYTLNKETAPPPPPDAKQMEAQQLAMNKQKVQEEAKRSQMAQQAAARVKAEQAAVKAGKEPGAKKRTSSTTMTLDDSWFTRGVDGEQGVEAARKAASQNGQPAPLKPQLTPGQSGAPAAGSTTAPTAAAAVK